MELGVCVIKCLDQSLGLFIGTAAAPFVFPHCDFGIELIPCDLHITSVKTVKSAFGPRGPIRPAHNPGFRGMKRLGVFLLPPGWDASPSQGYSPALNSPVPICTPGWREAL